MNTALKSKSVFLALALLFFALTGSTAFAWTESPSNPIYDPAVATEKAYYPSILKVGNADYRMWYQTNSTPSNTTVGYATSADGLSWTMVTNQVSGLLPDAAGHPFVKVVDGTYRIWYWNAATPYGNAAMHTAESVDGINWTNDAAITGNLTTVVSSQWNSGIYGAVDVIINTNPTNTGTNPFDYKYAMYFDATSGGYEQIGLGYSSDGIAWTLHGTGPVLAKGAAGTWDSGYVAIGSTVIKGDFWTLWYSGGISASNEGIGCATSVDGLVWAKCPNNPILSKSDGVAWRNSRTYTPKIIRDGNIYKMWFTGRDTATGHYTVGYATSPIAPVSGTLYLEKTSVGAATLPTSSLTAVALDENEILNVAHSVSTATNGTVVIAGVTATLASFTSGELSNVDLSTPKTVGEKSVVVRKAVRLSSGSGGAAITITNPNLPNTDVVIPDSTAILASNGWDGTIAPPKSVSTTDDTSPSGFSIGAAVEIGSPTEVLLFDKPVQVTLRGVTGSVGYKPSGSTVWTRITTTCDGTYAAPTLSAVAFPGECSISNGTDTKILSYHLTTFGGLIPVPPVAPTPAPAASSIRSGGTIPIIGIVSVPSPLDLPGGPGSVTYSYTVTNIGAQQALIDVTVTDDACSPIVHLSGDVNGNKKLDPTEKWKYSCTTTLAKTTTSTATVIGRGDDTDRTHAIAVAISTVVVGAPIVPPLINVIKVPSRLTPFQQGGGDVTYTYTVANPGVIAMHDVSMSDDHCSPIALLSGDTNGDTLLDPDESWIYSCQMHIATSTRNVATVQGKGNGLTAFGYAFTNVLVQGTESSALLVPGALIQALASAMSVPSTVSSQQVKTITVSLVQRDRGESVTLLQQFLMAQQGPAAEVLAAVGATGYFGDLTRAALAEYQRNAGISPAIGNFGPITRAYIQAHE